MKPRYRIQKDANHNEVVAYLEQHGVEVLDCSSIGKVPDLLVHFGQWTGWLEIKIPGSQAAFQKAQVKWMSETRWPVRIVTNKEDALVFAKTHEGMLTESQKYRLKPLLATKADQIRPADVMKAIGEK